MHQILSHQCVSTELMEWRFPCSANCMWNTPMHSSRMVINREALLILLWAQLALSVFRPHKTISPSPHAVLQPCLLPKDLWPLGIFCNTQGLSSTEHCQGEAPCRQLQPGPSAVVSWVIKQCPQSASWQKTSLDCWPKKGTCEGAFCFASLASLSWALHSLVLGQRWERVLASWSQGHRLFRCCKLTFNNSLLPGELPNSYMLQENPSLPLLSFSACLECQPWDCQYPSFLSKTPGTKQSGQFSNQHLDSILPLWQSVGNRTFAKACYKYTTQAQITCGRKRLIKDSATIRGIFCSRENTSFSWVFLPINFAFM